MKPNYGTTIQFTGPFREHLLTEFCRRNDLIGLCNIDVMFDAHLEKTSGQSALGTCPWCKQPQSFTLNGRSGAFQCSHCDAEGDFLDMMCLFLLSDLTGAVTYVFECIIEHDQKKAAARSKKRSLRRAVDRQMQGGLL